MNEESEKLSDLLNEAAQLRLDRERLEARILTNQLKTTEIFAALGVSIRMPFSPINKC